MAGPTAVGKGTVVTEMRRRYPQVWMSVSMTTRPPRPGEIDGVHYLFVTLAEFEGAIAAGQLLEWARVHGRHYYGTPRAPVLEHVAAGDPTLLEIDLQGARQVRHSLPDARFVFLAPPNFSDLQQRLITRGTESEQERAKRLETARIEMAAEGEFDAVIVNDTVAKAADELAALMGVSTPEYSAPGQRLV